MIKEVSGDILLSDAQAIAHGIAPHDHFDSGLAMSLRAEWPSLSKDFRHFCHQSNPKPGTAWVWTNLNGKRIVNLLEQEAPGGNSHGGRPGRASTEYVNHALHELKKIIAEEGIQSIALPRIATGVGGLKWEEVKPLIYNQLNDVNATVFIYTTYVKGQKAAEN